jgi:hypothetical protein
MAYLFIGILLGIVLEKFLVPIFETLLELFTYKVSESATISQLNSQAYVADFKREYPETVETSELQPCIGFDTSVTDSCENDDCDCKVKIGF